MPYNSTPSNPQDTKKAGPMGSPLLRIAAAAAALAAAASFAAAAAGDADEERFRKAQKPISH